jgi:Permuted papain-like amidase enzyme, YaeF/YiiX, C92 family
MPKAVEAGTFASDLARIEALARTPVASESDLKLTLSNLYRALYIADFSRYDVVAVRREAPQFVQRLFELRLALRGEIPGWARRGLMTRDVQKALRDVLRVTRYASDLIGELYIGHDKLGPEGKPRPGFTGSDLNVVVNPAFQTGADLPFRTGDVIVVRGQAHNSAAIARIGDIDSQFSHVGIVHVTPDGRHVKVEALIESGSVITPLDAALNHGLGRAIVFRHRDPALAANAAQRIHDLVAKRRLRRIWYDFTMRPEGYNRLYCSKLVRYAFIMASNGEVSLPAYSTRLDMKNRDFLDRVGVQTVETFAPGDLEIDPRFDLVAEWADYRITSSLRNQDLIATKLFEFMENHGFRFQEDWTIRLIGWLGRLSAHLSEDAKDLIAEMIPKVPPNMKRKTIAVVAMLHKTAQPLLEKLNEIERAEIARSGHPPHPREILAYLDEVRQASNGRIGYLAAPRG